MLGVPRVCSSFPFYTYTIQKEQKMDINQLKSSIAAWTAQEALSVEHEWHKAVTAFSLYVEGENAINDAISLLSQHGYTVSKQ